MAQTVTSPEGIKKDPKQPVGNPPLSDATLTSHLKNFNPPKETDAEIAADDLADELKDFKLPKTLKAAHELLNLLQAEQPADAAEGKFRDAKVQLVVAQISKLGMGTPPAEIDSDDRKEITDAQSDHADILKLQLLARSHPEVKALLEKCAGLEKQILELKK